MTAYYTPTGNPPAATRGTSAPMRSEFVAVQAGFTSAQADITTNNTTLTNSKANKAGETYTGTHDFTGGVALVPTQTVGNNSQNAASTAFVVATSLAATLPGQTSNAGKVITTDGTTASWGNRLKATVMGWVDGADATKQMLFSLSGITTGTTRTITIPDKSGTLAMTSDLFSSAEQVITAAGVLTIAHGLGAIPRLVCGFLKCVTAENGYSIGDVLCVPIGQADRSGITAYGVSVVVDATNLTVRYGGSVGVFAVLHKTTGSDVAITAANWTFSLRAQP